MIPIRTPYVPPANWRRNINPPCTCEEEDNCPICYLENSEVVEGPSKLLDVDDGGKCFSGGATYTLPDIGTVVVGWCVDIQNNQNPITIQTYESNNGGGVFILVDGQPFTQVGFPAPLGEMCICCLDGTTWVATGDVVGGGPT